MAQLTNSISKDLVFKVWFQNIIISIYTHPTTHKKQYTCKIIDFFPLQKNFEKRKEKINVHNFFFLFSLLKFIEKFCLHLYKFDMASELLVLIGVNICDGMLKLFTHNTSIIRYYVPFWKKFYVQFL